MILCLTSLYSPVLFSGGNILSSIGGIFGGSGVFGSFFGGSNFGGLSLDGSDFGGSGGSDFFRPSNVALSSFRASSAVIAPFYN